MAKAAGMSPSAIRWARDAAGQTVTVSVTPATSATSPTPAVPEPAQLAF